MVGPSQGKRTSTTPVRCGKQTWNAGAGRRRVSGSTYGSDQGCNEHFGEPVFDTLADDFGGTARSLTNNHRDLIKNPRGRPARTLGTAKRILMGGSILFACYNLDITSDVKSTFKHTSVAPPGPLVGHLRRQQYLDIPLQQKFS